MKLTHALRTIALTFGLVLIGSVAQAADKKPATAEATAGKPNIVVIMTDDVGIWNISAYHRGMMGGRTPNIDRIASEGALFTDYYAQQSCTAGRAAFITGQLLCVDGGLLAHQPYVADFTREASAS